MLKQKSSEYRGYRMPGIRLREPIDPQLGKIYGEHMQPFLPAVHAFDKAHTVMLIEEGLLDSAAGIATLRVWLVTPATRTPAWSPLPHRLLTTGE